MSTLLKPLQVRADLLRRGAAVFTGQDFERMFRVSKFRAKYFLEEYTKAGLFIRLKRGLYALHDRLPSEEEIANLLYRPSYLSFEFALAVYAVLPEMVYTVTSATTKSSRTFAVEQKTFTYFTIKQGAFTGYGPIKWDNRTILMAEPEKALVDYLYFVSLGKRSSNDRLALANLDRNKVLQYARLYQRKGLERLVREVL
jgi:predicted transcriptional regulator of viral defense system